MKYHVSLFESLPSTNTLLKELAKKGAPLGTVICAKSQSAGRGRLGRAFASPEGGLYMSVLLPLDDPQKAGMLTTHAAVAVSRAIEAESGIEVGIKWVNDLFFEGKKLCGILAEAVKTESGYAAVLGIGVNLWGELPSELSCIAVTLENACKKRIEPQVLCRRILDGLLPKSPESTIDEYRERSIIIGKSITVRPKEGEEYEAVAWDIENDGSLIIEKEGKRVRLFFGEVSLKI